MRKYFIQQGNKGYTLIETMIAISLFLVIAVMGMGAFLNANVVYQKSQDMRSILDSLGFIMEDMSRNLRTGYNYRCYDTTLPWSDSYAQNNGGANNNTSLDLNRPRSCASGGAIVFESELGRTPTSVVPDPNATDQLAYKIESTRTAPGGTPIFDISESTNGGLNWVRLNPDEVFLSSVSGVSVLGAESYASGDRQQPFIVIRLIGTITFKNVTTPFSLQTSVSQRRIDV